MQAHNWGWAIGSKRGKLELELDSSSASAWTWKSPLESFWDYFRDRNSYLQLVHKIKLTCSSFQRFYWRLKQVHMTCCLTTCSDRSLCVGRYQLDWYYYSWYNFRKTKFLTIFLLENLQTLWSICMCTVWFETNDIYCVLESNRHFCKCWVAIECIFDVHIFAYCVCFTVYSCDGLCVPILYYSRSAWVTILADYCINSSS